jgi:hypothetical protein
MQPQLVPILDRCLRPALGATNCDEAEGLPEGGEGVLPGVKLRVSYYCLSVANYWSLTAVPTSSPSRAAPAPAPSGPRRPPAGAGSSRPRLRSAYLENRLMARQQFIFTAGRGSEGPRAPQRDPGASRARGTTWAAGQPRRSLCAGRARRLTSRTPTSSGGLRGAPSRPMGTIWSQILAKVLKELEFA